MKYAIGLIILGILAVPSLLLKKKPNAQQLLDKLTPYQGWIGLVFCFWGIWGIISSVLTISWLAKLPILWITTLLVSIVTGALGFIVGFSKINELLLSKNEEAKKKGKEVLAKLLPFQEKLGIAAIILGIWGIVSSILFVMD